MSNDVKRPDIILSSREEMLAAVLLVERHSRSVLPDGRDGGLVVYRYATEEDANNHLKEEARVLADPKFK